MLLSEGQQGEHLSILIAIQMLIASAHAQQNCMSCAPLIQSLNDKDSKLDRIKVILKKNEDYIRDNPTAATSILVKVRSNILVSRLQIETFQNEKQILDNTIQERGCDSCRTKSTRDH